MVKAQTDATSRTRVIGTLLKEARSLQGEYSAVNSRCAPDRTDTMRSVDRLLRATAQAEGRHFWFRGFRAFVVPLLRQATEGSSEVRLLDCGCGTGANVEL